MRKEMLFESVGVQVMRSSWGRGPGALPRGWQSLDRPRISFPESVVMMGGGASVDLVAPGGAVLLDKECEHGIRPGDERGGMSLWVSFDPEVFDALVGGETRDRLRGSGESDPGRLVVSPDDRACLALRAVACAADAGALDPVDVEALMYELVERVCETGSGAAGKRAPKGHCQAVAHAAAMIERGEGVTLGDVGRAVHMEPHHFCRVFKRHTGMTVHGLRRRVRLLRAAERVLSGAEALSRVACECGYSDQAHMTRAFTRAFGVPPAQLRRGAPGLAQLRRIIQDVGGGQR